MVPSLGSLGAAGSRGAGCRGRNWEFAKIQFLRTLTPLRSTRLAFGVFCPGRGPASCGLLGLGGHRDLGVGGRAAVHLSGSWEKGSIGSGASASHLLPGLWLHAERTAGCPCLQHQQCCRSRPRSVRAATWTCGICSV